MVQKYTSYNRCWVILCQSQFNNYSPQSYMVQKCISNHFKEVNSSLSETDLFDSLVEPPKSSTNPEEGEPGSNDNDKEVTPH